MTQTIDWEIFGGIEGADACRQRLDSAFATATERLTRAVAAGTSIPLASAQAFDEMAAVLGSPENIPFGTTDGEVVRAAEYGLSRFVRNHYGWSREEIRADTDSTSTVNIEQDADGWSLYAIPGAEDCARRLNLALASAVAVMDARIADGMGLPKAVTESFLSVQTSMFRKENARYGSADGEPSSSLGRILTKYVRTRYGLEGFRINGYGDVEEHAATGYARR